MKDVVGQALRYAVYGLVACLGAIAFAFVTTFIAAIPLMLLWNWLMPLIFGLPQLTFVEALGVSALSTLLFVRYTPSSSN